MDAADLAPLVIGFILVAVFLYVFLNIPNWIARSRNVSAETIKSINLLCFIALFLGVTWLVALIWACVAPPEDRVPAGYQPYKGFAKRIPTEPTEGVASGYEGRGRYKIVGVDESTGFDVVDWIEAASKKNAELKAKRNGVLVSEISFDP